MAVSPRPGRASHGQSPSGSLIAFARPTLERPNRKSCCWPGPAAKVSRQRCYTPQRALIEDTGQAWTCLHRQAANAELPEDTFSKLPIKDGHAWVVVIDDADNIGPAILAGVKKIAARTDVHLLLAAREASGISSGLCRGYGSQRPLFTPSL